MSSAKSPNLVKTLSDYYVNWARLSIDYFSIYLEAFKNTFCTTQENSTYKEFYDNLVSKLDIEFTQQLKTDHFTKLLSSYIDSFIDVRECLRSTGIPIESYEILSYETKKNFLNMLVSSVGDSQYVTQSEIVYQRGKIRLLHYLNENNGIPVILVYAQINHFDLMDLNYEKSVVRRLGSLGLDVYVLDWGYRGREDDHLSLQDYINYLNEVILSFKEKTGLDKVPVIGYCWGGLVSLTYAALFKQNVQSLVLLATPVDFSKDDGLLATWSKAIDADKIINEFGHMDGNLLDYAFMMRNPHRNFIDKYFKTFTNFADRKFLENFFELERWLHNTPPIPGNIYRQIINDGYKKNSLIENKLKVGEKTVSLREIDIPLFVAVAEKDDLVSPASTLAVNQYISSTDKSQICISGGHVGLCISKVAHEKLWPEIAKWIKDKNGRYSVPTLNDEEKTVITV